ncbi:MAG: fumarylacetoacetate hydrolase family protein [Lautropia sp.]
MKLATLRTTERDGRLLVVSRDLTRALDASAVAPDLQSALDAWDVAEPRLRALSQSLEQGNPDGTFPLDPARLAAPLPRAYAWIDASVYLNHMELARKLRGAPNPVGYQQEPMLANGAASFLGGRDPLGLPPGDVGLDIEGEVAAILGDVPVNTPVSEAARYIRLFTLVNDTTLRTVFADQHERGFTSYHGKLTCVMAPVAVTPDELGAAWDGRVITAPLRCEINGQLLGEPNTGVDWYFDFPTIVAAATRYRALMAGTVLGSGTVSNRARAAGSACIAERRMLEVLDAGAPKTPYLQPGDTLRIDMRDPMGQSLFGAIEQQVVARAR